MPIAVTLHLLATVVWVGGMFFAHMMLRPAAQPLAAPERLALMARVFDRFFPWVWGAVLLLPLTGYWMIFDVFQGMANVGLHVHAMQLIGIGMIGIYLHVFFAPYRRMNRAIAAGDFPAAGRQLAVIRRLVGVNLTLGLITITVATGGAYWGTMK